MAELFSSASISSGQYTPGVWMPLYEVKSTIVGALVFDLSIANATKDSNLPVVDISVDCKIINKDGQLVRQFLSNKNISPDNEPWICTSKVVLNPGDRLLVKASENGANFYCSIVTSLKVA